MSNEDQTKWIGLTWDPADKVPVEAKQELAKRLDSLLDVLMPIEVDYRRQILEVRADCLHRMDLDAFLK